MKPLNAVYAAACLLSCIALGYFIPREQPELLIMLSLLWFGACLMLFRTKDQISFPQIIGLAFLLRIVLIPVLPPLSDDFFRFLWDGDLLSAGMNPYAHLPVDAMVNSPVKLNQLNSPEYYTVYPPFSQLLFGASSFLFPDGIMGRVITLRLVYIGFDMFNLYLLMRLLALYDIGEHWLILYAFHPLVVMEFVGNLHLEVFMLTGLLVFGIGLKEKRPGLAIVGLAFAIHMKLLPVILIPYLILRHRRGLQISIVALVVAFVPFGYLLFTGTLENWMESISYYNQLFEFNGSVYLLFRDLGFLIFGYNTISWLGPLLNLIAAGLILYFSFFYRYQKGRFFRFTAIAWLIFYLFSTTVHPWYIAPLVAFGLMSGMRSPFVFSITALFSYFAYGNQDFSLPIWISLGIYIPVFASIALDYVRLKDEKRPMLRSNWHES